MLNKLFSSLELLKVSRFIQTDHCSLQVTFSDPCFISPPLLLLEIVNL